MSNEVCLLTPTWSGDQVHFELMRASIERSALAETTHHVVVQTEDLELFRPYVGSTVKLIPTKDVLPGEVEEMRQRARRMQVRLGRGGTRIMGSLARHTGWPRWVPYTGWHVQQITKLAMAAASEIDNVVAIDSDVVVTRHARVDDFIQHDGIVCFHRQSTSDQVIRKVLNWNRQAHALFDQPFTSETDVEAYFDTPFVFHAPTVRRMLSWLEQRYDQPWWVVLLGQPPRRWSEFGTYRMFLRAIATEQSVDWRSDSKMRYLFDASNPQALRDEFAQVVMDPDSHYVTIHSQSSGRQLWGADEYVPLILPLLDKS